MRALLDQIPRRVEACTIERQQLAGGEPVYILKVAASRNYIKVSAPGLFLWQQIDGRRTIRDLCTAYMGRFEQHAPADVLHALAQFTETGCVTFDGMPAAEAAAPRPKGVRDRIVSLCSRYYSIPDIDARVTWLYGHLHPLYGRLWQAVLLVVAAAGVLAWHFGSAVRPNPSLVVWIAGLALHVVVHEAAHAVTCKHFGRSVHRAGIGWYLFAPVAFVDTSDMWAAAKLPRILVSAAGPYANLVLAGAASLIALLPMPASAVEALSAFSITGYVLALVNLNPLLELDGYYVLMDLVEVPNLRSRALACFAAELSGRRGTEPRLRPVFVLFGAACLAYGIVVAVGMLQAYRVFIGDIALAWMPEPYAHAAGWALAAAMSLAILVLLFDAMRSRPGRS
jgi:putative peptide zinc metalloprotease protein